MTMFRTVAIASLAGAALALGACSESGTSAEASAPDAAPAWILADAPADARGILAAKADAAEGDAIVLRGIVGGSVEPISAQSPVFSIVDTNLYNRCTIGDDHCPTPWDYCCADTTELATNTATVQIVDASGTVLGQGIDPMDEVIVVGTVAPRPNDQVLIVRATGVHRVGG